MTKYVEVKSCRQCIHANIRYVEYLKKYDNTCEKQGKPLEEFEWDSPIPAWCPLPDLEEKEK